MIPLDDALVRSPIVHVLNSSEGRNSDLEKKSMDNIGEGQITPGGGGLYFSPHYPQKRRFHLPIEIGRILAGFLKEPPVYILACKKSDKVRRMPLKTQLNQMMIEQEPDPAKYSIINALRRLGPGICTVISEFGPFEMQISRQGLFHNPVFPTDFKMLTDSEVPAEISPHVAAYLVALIMLLPTVMLVRTLTDETVCIKKGQNSITPVTVKELRGFQTELITDTNGERYVKWRKLTPVETRRLYELDNDTNGSFEFEVKEREYRFVQ